MVNRRSSFCLCDLLSDNAKIQYLCMILLRENLHQFNNLHDQVESTTTTYLNQVILGLCAYFRPMDALSQQKLLMRRGMRKTHNLKLRCYAACMIDIDEYLYAFQGAKASDKIGETELNEILLNSMPN